MEKGEYSFSFEKSISKKDNSNNGHISSGTNKEKHDFQQKLFENNSSNTIVFIQIILYGCLFVFCK